MDKILTIVIPTYNMEKLLGKALNSLLVSEGNMDSLEVLVVNDGSKDKSSEIGHRYENKYPNTFRVIDKENGNYGSCVNRGLSEAKGKYIKVLDADDFFDSAALDQYVSFLQNVDVDMVVSDFRIVDPEGNVLKNYSFTLPKDTVFDLSAFKNERERILLWHHAIAFKTENLRDIGYKQTEGISYTDEQWVFMPMVKVKKIVYFPKMVYMYLRGREGQTYDPNVLAKTFKQLFQVAKTQTDFYIEWMGKMEASKGLKDYLWTRLTQKNWKIYRFYTLKQSNEENNERLAEYDRSIESRCPQLYHYLSNRNYELHFPFIRLWRESGYNRNTAKLRSFRFLFCTAYGFRDLLRKAGLIKNHDNGQ